MGPSLKFKRALRSAARLPGRVSGVRSSSGRNVFTPQPNEQPLVVLRIQVVGCTGLLAKDRNGNSDPFVVVSVLNTRHQTPVAKRNVNPTYAAQDATFDFELYVSLADKLGAVELVVWDKDMVGKDYLGEVAIPLEEWFGDDRPFAFNDPANKPFSVNLESTRANTSATGAVQLKLGFAAPANAQTELHFDEIYRELVKRSRPSLVSAPPTEGVGTIRSRAGSPDLEDDGGLSSNDESDNEAEFVDAPEEASAPPTPLSDHTPPAAPVAVTEEKEKERHPTPAADVIPAIESKKKAKKAVGKGAYSLEAGNDILGIVMLEVQRAEDLPKLKNMMHTGWDMDPFAVISFGKKVFRTRVVRHALNPTWDEKLLFHVRRYETNFHVQLSIHDWDKLSGNDRIGETGFEVRELIEKAPQKNPETGLYDMEENGEREMIDFKLKLDPGAGNGGLWELRHSPFIYVRAKYQPYDALRQRFWRHYLKQYDTDDTNTISHIELTSMLDSLGSTLTRDTVHGFFTKYGKEPHRDELTVEEVIRTLEEELGRPDSEKRRVDEVDGLSSDTSAVQTPAVTGDAEVGKLDINKMDFSGPPHSQARSSDDSIERVINVKNCPMCHRPRMSDKAEVDIITHLAVCASQDWEKVDRIVVGDFVTANQAQRKWYTKIITKVSSGDYRLGANSANIIVQSRMTGQLEEEKMQVYVRLGIRLLYKGATSRMEGGRARRLLKSLSIKQGIKYDAPESALDIPTFIEFHGLKVEEILDPLDSFKTFNEFFYRKLKPSARPIEKPDDPYRLVSAADCRVMTFATVDDATHLWIKGREFTVARLLGDTYKDQAERYTGGALAIFRLAPQDYHRYHSPVEGRIGPMTVISGEYYTVNPQAIRSSLDVYGENVRKIVPIDSPHFGRVMAVCVGAMMVGSIKTTVQEGEYVLRGQEFGYFAFGGSTIVLLFEKDAVEWDEDLLINGQASLETLVRVGMGIGTGRRESAD